MISVNLLFKCFAWISLLCYFTPSIHGFSNKRLLLSMYALIYYFHNSSICGSCMSIVHIPEAFCFYVDWSDFFYVNFRHISIFCLIFLNDFFWFSPYKICIGLDVFGILFSSFFKASFGEVNRMLLDLRWTFCLFLTNALLLDVFLCFEYSIGTSRYFRNSFWHTLAK